MAAYAGAPPNHLTHGTPLGVRARPRVRAADAPRGHLLALMFVDLCFYLFHRAAHGVLISSRLFSSRQVFSHASRCPPALCSWGALCSDASHNNFLLSL